MSTYPIVEAHHLEPAATRGFLNMGRRKRKASELPKAGAHEAWVFRVDGDYVEDRGQLSRDDDRVVRADHVSLVNLGEGVPITVHLPVPSAEASDFTIQVTFACTVTDPTRVVRQNLSAEETIRGYLRRDSKISHLGLKYRMTELNQVRLEASGRIRAYSEVKPLEVTGMRARLVSVEVLTPDEVAEVEREKRKARAAHDLETQRRGFSQDLEIDQDRHSRMLADRQRMARYQVDEEDLEHAQVTAIRKQRHEQMLQLEKMEFARREVEQAVESIGGNPLRALIYAQSLGEIDAKDLAERMLADRQQQEETRRLELEWQRDEGARTQRDERDDRNRRDDQEREDRIRRQDQERQDRLRREDLEREDLVTHRREVREDNNRQLEIKLQVLQEMAKHGHLDMVSVRVDRLLEDLSGMAPSVVASPDREQISAAESAAPIEGSKASVTDKAGDDGAGDGDEPIDIDVEVREEDD
jgi:hypothetical protein